MDGRYQWLPLSQHLEDARRVADRLWLSWLNEAQRKQIIESLSIQDETIAKKLVQFLGATHDIGKASASFQIQQGYPLSIDLDKELLERLERAGFNGISNAKLPSPRQSPHALASQAILFWYGVNEDIGSIIGGHHGRPIDSRSKYKVQSSYEENYYQVDIPSDSVYQKWKRTQKEAFEWALGASGFDSVEDLPLVSQPTQVILTGLLIMADWIASNEEYFPLIELDQLHVEKPEKRFEKGWEKWFKSQPWKPDYNLNSRRLYKKRFGFKNPRNVQTVFSEVIEQTDKPGIFILEAPMGVGKTEAALVGVEQLVGKTGHSGIFFGLPTQATSDGIYPRIHSWLESIRSEYKDNLPIRLVHGKSKLNKDFASVARNVDIDGEGNGNVFVNEWFSGRKTAVLDDFVVGTVDQFLLMSLKQKHVALRHLGFSKKVVVLDEIHSYDAYTSEYIQGALNWMGAYGVPVIILSATLASNVRKDLITSYLKGGEVRLAKEFDHGDIFKTDAYPLITYTDNDQILQVKDFASEESKIVKVIRIEEESLVPLIDDLCQHDGIIGIVVNTVKRAQSLARYYISKYGEDRVELLHSNFIATDRVEKEKNLLNMIGKDANRPKRKIIIGTQVIEQSLDINFDVLISDLAPIDLLIQRVGRLHRHDIKYPEYYSEPTLYVVGTNKELEFESGSSAVYGDYLLARTQYYLGDNLNLPDDISPLVQKVYQDADIDLVEELQAKYQDMKEKQVKLIRSKKRRAKTYKVDFPDHELSPDINLIGWLNSAPVDTQEELALAQVRDINETIEVVALKKIGDGYGLFGETEDLSSEVRDYKVAAKLSEQTLRLPYALSYPSVINETINELESRNLKELARWQDQPWLRGSLGIIFDEENQYKLNGYLLTYDAKYGLVYEKE